MVTSIVLPALFQVQRGLRPLTEGQTSLCWRLCITPAFWKSCDTCCSGIGWGSVHRFGQRSHVLRLRGTAPKYFEGIVRDSFSVIGLWLRNTKAQYKVIHEELSLQLASFEPEEPHIILLPAIDRGAEETLSHRDKKTRWTFVWDQVFGTELALEEGNRQMFQRGLYLTHLQCIHIFYPSFLY